MDHFPSGAPTIVSFDNEGNHRWNVVLDPAEIRVDAFAAFSTGDLLLVGHRPGTSDPRVAIRPTDGSALRDVLLMNAAETGPLQIGGLSPALHVEASSDGRVYIAGSSGRVYAVSPSGDASSCVELGTPPKAGARLVGIRLSGRRMAAIYAERSPGPMASSVYWATTYDISTGQPTALYGPIRHSVVCYHSQHSREGDSDRFTLFTAVGGRQRLLTASKGR